MLEGKTAVVTGAGRNIGRCIAQTFANHGASVVVNDVDESRAQQVVTSLHSGDEQRHQSLVCDAIDPDSVQQAATQLQSEYDEIDILVNNLGYAENKSIFETTPDEWHNVVDLTMTSTYLWTKYVGELIANSTGGSIINLGSALGHGGQSDKLAYCAAKSGVINMTRQLALDLAEFDVRVNSISPGIVGDPVGQTSGKQDREKNAPEIVPLGRNGRPEDIGNAALYLASDFSEYITGADLRVDGGITAAYGGP